MWLPVSFKSAVNEQKPLCECSAVKSPDGGYTYREGGEIQSQVQETGNCNFNLCKVIKASRT